MNRSTEIEIKVGIFVAIGTTLIMLTILLLGGGQSLFQRSIIFHAKFQQVEGLVEGATVKVAGVKVGQVQKIQFIKDSGFVDVHFSISHKFKDAIHADSFVEIQTQGVLGDRYLIISTGSPGSELAENGAELKSQAPKDLKDYLNNADEVLARLKNSLSYMENILGSFQREGRAEVFFKNITGFSSNVNNATQALPNKMKDIYGSMEHMKSIMAKIDGGQGTLGALVNDASLYDDLKALLGGANRNRVLKYFIKKSVDDAKEAQKKDEKQ